MIPRLWCLAALALLLLTIGCNGGGGGGLEIREIEGPSLIAENSSAEFSVEVTGETGITYAWAVEPVSAGNFTNQTSATTTFNATIVNGHLDATIRVTVSSSRFGPEVRSKEIEIREVGNLKVSEIAGATEIPEKTASVFTVEADGDFGIIYEWTCDPPSAVALTLPESPQTTLLAPFIGEDMQVTLTVTVTSDNFGPVTRSVDVIILETQVLEAGEIEGPGLIEEGFPAEYSVDTFGDSGIEYLWTVDPPSAGSFDDPASAKTNFTSASIATEASARISVEVMSDFYSGIGKSLDIEVLDMPDYLWGVTWGGESSCSSAHMVIDQTGNCYIAGSFGGNVSFGPGGPVLVSVDSSDAFLALFDSAGAVRWAVSWGGVYDDEVEDFAIDDSGNAYILGTFADYIDFDPGPGVYYLTSGGQRDVYLLSVDSMGRFRWVASWGNATYGDYAVCIVCDGAGNTSVYGQFEGQVDFDPGPGIVQIAQMEGKNYDFFISRFNSSGVFQSVLTGAQSTGLDAVSDMALDDQGNLWLTGGYDNVVDFDPGPGIDERSTFYYYTDCFLTKLGPTGGYYGTVTWGGNRDDSGESVAIGVGGSAFVCGYFEDIADFEPGPDYDYRGSTEMYKGAFVSSFDANLNRIYSQVWYGDDRCEADVIAVDAAERTYVRGWYEGPVDFDPSGRSLIKVQELHERGDYLSCFDSSGELLWNLIDPSSDNTAFGAIALNLNDELLMANALYDTADIDPTAGVDERTANNERDSCLIKLLP